MREVLVVAAVCGALLFGGVASAQPLPLGSPMRGITVGPIENTQQAGRGYGTPYSAELLDHLAEMGTTWISVTPFGRIWSLDSTEILMDFEAPYEDNRASIREVVAQARQRGIKVLLIPHLWVETGGWRGEIDFDSEEGWAAYHASYREFVLAWARDAAAAGAHAFSIGVECKSWSARFPDVWSALIADVRAVFPGLLTYSSNWDEAEAVVFWEELDLIGINAFYPLHHENGATDAQYMEGAFRVRDSVSELHQIHHRPVLFIEVGYTTRANAAVEPWLWPDGMQNVVIDEREQARALEAMFAALTPEPWFAGFFIWRYYANLDDVSQEAQWGFSPHAKEAEQVVADTFAARWGRDTPLWPWELPQAAFPADPPMW